MIKEAGRKGAEEKGKLQCRASVEQGMISAYSHRETHGCRLHLRFVPIKHKEENWIFKVRYPVVTGEGHPEGIQTPPNSG